MMLQPGFSILVVDAFVPDFAASRQRSKPSPLFIPPVVSSMEVATTPISLRLHGWPSLAGPSKTTPGFRIWKHVKRIFSHLPGLHRHWTKDRTTTTDDDSDTVTVNQEDTEKWVTTQESPHPDVATTHAVDLSGTWKPIWTPEFKRAYDRYLQNCGEGLWYRKALLAAMSGLGSYEVYQQTANNTQLSITSVSPVKSWQRVLGTSPHPPNEKQENEDEKYNKNNNDGENTYDPIISSFRDPDGDMVHVEAWWEKGGTVHASILRGKPLVQGGTFETKRYLESPNILICESTFHPPSSGTAGGTTTKFQEDHVTWRYERSS
eukprot:scaffold5357_cov208-Amphora_coffeaeformis.AAC.12